MTTAEKLIRAKADLDEVYSVGYEKGKSEGGGISPTNYASEIIFSNDDWAESDNVVIDMPNLSYINRTLFYCASFNKIKTLTVRSETPITFCKGAFQATSGTDELNTLEKLILYLDFSQCTAFSNIFMARQRLVSIEGNPIDFSSAITIVGTFDYLWSLQSLRVVPNSIHVSISFLRCPSLDDATIQNIIDGLADLTGGTAQTLTLNADVKAKLTDTQLATITGKNWTLA